MIRSEWNTCYQLYIIKLARYHSAPKLEKIVQCKRGVAQLPQRQKLTVFKKTHLCYAGLIEFSLCGKQCDFPKLHFFQNLFALCAYLLVHCSMNIVFSCYSILELNRWLNYIVTVFSSTLYGEKILESLLLYSMTNSYLHRQSQELELLVEISS